MAMTDLSYSERLIISVLLDDAAAAGYLVSVYDGEEWACNQSADQTAVRLVIGDTDETTLRFRNPAALDDCGKPEVVGSVALIHGNGADVISDYSDNPAMCAVLDRANAVADGLAA